MLRRFSTNFALFSMLLDTAGVALSLLIATAIRPSMSELALVRDMFGPVRVPPALFLVFPLLWVIIASVVAVYDGRRYLRVVDEFTALTGAALLWSVSAAGLLYLSFRDVSRALFIVFVVLAYIVALAWRAAVRVYFRMQKGSGDGGRRVIVVGVGPLGRRVRSQLERSEVEDVKVLGFVDDEPMPDAADEPLLGGTSSLGTFVSGREITDVVIALPHSAYERLGHIVAALERLPVRIWVALGFFDLALYRTGIEDFEGIPMLDLRASAIDDYQRMMKRGLDLMLSVVLLVVSAPLMALAALLILADDGGPVIFKQLRVGENGRLFQMLKFRTMVKDAERMRPGAEHVGVEENTIHKMRDDRRVTRVGRLLRRLSVDELPQLWNVIRGEMSVVGPRPELPQLVEQYQPWQRKRFSVPPGITGWWQVRGRSDRPMHLHTEDDLHYIQSFSVWLDIEILLRTIWAVLLGRGAY